MKTTSLVLNTFRTSGALWTASLILDRMGVGVLRLWPRRHIPKERLAKQISAILSAWGMPPEHVCLTTNHLIYADLHGIDGEGCAMLLSYRREISAGTVSVSPKIEVVREDCSTAVIDGGGGLGHTPGEMAMQMAIRKCRETGLAAVAVRNSGHFGAAGLYALMAAQNGVIGIATTNTRQPAVVPVFAARAALGTNPVAFAAPACNNRPFLLDMATSTVSLGKLLTAWRRGRSIPPGWAVDIHGQTETSARGAIGARHLTPLGGLPEAGGHKGYGLAAMVEILSSVLPGNPVRKSAGMPGNVGHFFLALDPSKFRTGSEFESDMDCLLDSLRACRPADARHPVLVPGDPEYAAQAERSRTGIPLTRAVIEDLRALSREGGAPFLLEN